ncbi:MAG TPA: DUF2946 family protein [Bradyrhizobium sp.]|nr:DUF2946 family protein [Bradyrhizobium sp.]
MRRRLQRFVPIILIALAVQILAPMAVCWAAATAISDPLRFAEICHSDPASPTAPTDRGADHRAYVGSCPICCAAQLCAAFDAPPATAFAAPYRQATRVVWRARTQALAVPRAGSNAQARAPPFIS